jgi:tetratricopeptide (TPR) repeat protein
MRTHALRTVPRVRFALSLAVIGSLCGCQLATSRWNNHEGMSYFKEGNYTLAKHQFRQAVADQPYNVDYVHNLATAMKKQGDQAGAERTYRQALDMDPSHQPSYHGLALMLKEQGRNDDAYNLLETWTATQPYTPASHVEMAWYQRENGNTVAAEQSLQTALQTQPNHPIALAHLGQLFEDTGQSDRALAMYQRSLHNSWYQPRVHSRLSALDSSRGSLRTSPQRFAWTYQGRSTTSIAGRYQPRRVALQYPPPNYGAPGPFALAPVRSAGAPAVVLGQPTSISNADPAHAPTLSSGPPLAEPR